MAEPKGRCVEDMDSCCSTACGVLPQFTAPLIVTFKSLPICYVEVTSTIVFVPESLECVCCHLVTQGLLHPADSVHAEERLSYLFTLLHYRTHGPR